MALIVQECRSVGAGTMPSGSRGRRSRPISVTSAARSRPTTTRVPRRRHRARRRLPRARGGEIVGVAATERRGDGIYIDQLVSPGTSGHWPGELPPGAGRGDRAARAASRNCRSRRPRWRRATIRLYRRHGFEIVQPRPPPAHGMDAHMRVHHGEAVSDAACSRPVQNCSSVRARTPCGRRP